MNHRCFAQDALLPDGWARDVLLQWNEHGRLTNVVAGAEAPGGVPRAAGPLVPGLPNLHSHAFQRAFAGLTEHRARHANGGQDSFWSWRTLMYRFASRITPDQLALAVMKNVTGSVVTATAKAAGEIGNTGGAAAAEGAKKAVEGIKGLFGGKK